MTLPYKGNPISQGRVINPPDSPFLGLRILRLPSVAQDDMSCHSELAEESAFPLRVLRILRLPLVAQDDIFFHSGPAGLPPCGRQLLNIKSYVNLILNNPPSAVFAEGG